MECRFTVENERDEIRRAKAKDEEEKKNRFYKCFSRRFEDDIIFNASQSSTTFSLFSFVRASCLSLESDADVRELFTKHGRNLYE